MWRQNFLPWCGVDSMSRKDYRIIAAALYLTREHIDTVQRTGGKVNAESALHTLELSLCSSFSQENHRFSMRTFLRACRPASYNLPACTDSRIRGE